MRREKEEKEELAGMATGQKKKEDMTMNRHFCSCRNLKTF